MTEGLEALEAMARPGAGAFLFGDTLTLADVCLVPQMYNARRFTVPIDALSDLAPGRRECAARCPPLPRPIPIARKPK